VTLVNTGQPVENNTAYARYILEALKSQLTKFTALSFRDTISVLLRTTEHCYEALLNSRLTTHQVESTRQHYLPNYIALIYTAVTLF
jgi:hypothetical protein